MTVFSEYARYYDLLYRDKDYAGEAEYVHGLIQTHAPRAKSILNLGCGSGRHDRELVKKGYTVTGVDLSEEMLAAARNATQPNSALAYVQGDVRTIQLANTFDVIISLFHVMSYQTTNQGLLAAFETARHHLKHGGIFIFDCWYGPGVLTDRPAVRVKELEDDDISVTRIAQPVMHSNENVVDVNYRMFLREKADDCIREIYETHRMRYLFLPEIKLMLDVAGFEIEKAEEWLTSAPLNFNSWNAVFVCPKKVHGAAV